MKSTVPQIARELEKEFRIVIADAKKDKASAWRTQRWSELATSQAFLNGLEVGPQIVKHVMIRYGGY